MCCYSNFVETLKTFLLLISLLYSCVCFSLKWRMHSVRMKNGKIETETETTKQRNRNESERNGKRRKVLLMDFNSLHFFEFSILITVILISSNLTNKWSERRWVGYFFRWSSKYLSSLYGFNAERMTLWLPLVFIRFVRSIHLLSVGHTVECTVQNWEFHKTLHTRLN